MSKMKMEQMKSKKYEYIKSEIIIKRKRVI